ncbi:hypothetical protein BV392_11520 [Rhodovulum sulfidophilum]|nr:hypothetical protein BV392_11520 [Rhodovulum sulfidophilum]
MLRELGALGFRAVNVRLARLDTTRGLILPPVILPPTSVIGAQIATGLPILWCDFVQTFV